MAFGKDDAPEFSRNLKIYQKMIKPVLQECGYEAIRADELEHMGNITRDIIELLHEADLVVADLSGRNANVYYELGVRHALYKRGTIPIIKKGENLPFDIANYRAIFYSTELDGPNSFSSELSRRIKVFEKSSLMKSDNPVHDILGEKLSLESGVTNEQIKQIEELNSQLEQELKVQKEMKKAQQAEIKAISSKKEAYQKQIDDLQNRIKELQSERQTRSITSERSKANESSAVSIFRCTPKELDTHDVSRMLKQHDFFDSRKNRVGKGGQHNYEKKVVKGDRVVFDWASGLMWQASGSDKELTFAKAENWLKDLNIRGFAGKRDWRLPTLEEAMSLLESSQRNGDLFIDSVFDKTLRWIWTCDAVRGKSWVWVVLFDIGLCSNLRADNIYSYVRAVRSLPLAE